MNILKPIVNPTVQSSECPTFQTLQRDAEAAIEALFRPLLSLYSDNKGKVPSASLVANDLQNCRKIGRAWWKVHTSIVLLSTEGREKVSRNNPTRSSIRPTPSVAVEYIHPCTTSKCQKQTRGGSCTTACLNMELCSHSLGCEGKAETKPDSLVQRRLVAHVRVTEWLSYIVFIFFLTI